MARRIEVVVLAMLCQGLLHQAGCQEPREPSTICYCLPHPEDLGQIHRVAFVGLTGQDAWPGVAEDTTVALAQAIAARRLFRLEVVPADDPRCRALALDGASAFTMQGLRDMQVAFQCDAVLVGQIRDFRPHPRTQLGLYLRLIDVKNGRLVWGIDHAWDSTDKHTEESIKRFFADNMRSGYEPMNWQLAIISPKFFEKFVAFEVADTLPAPPPRKEAATPRPPANGPDFRKIQENLPEIVKMP
jgi:hypothetical protein